MASKRSFFRGAVGVVLALLSVGLFLVSAPPAKAQVSGDVSIDISFPPLLVLYYYGNMTVTISAADLATFMTTRTLLDQGPASAAADSSFQADFALTDPGINPADITAVPMLLQNAWAVRSVGSTGSTSVTATLLTDTTLTGDSGGTIDISSVSASPASFAPTGFFGFQQGDLSLELDLTAATRAGNYSNAAGDQFRITVNHL